MYRFHISYTVHCPKDIQVNTRKLSVISQKNNSRNNNVPFKFNISFYGPSFSVSFCLNDRVLCKYEF